jgi:hypothetical protein
MPEWREMNNEELQNVSYSSDIVVMKARRIRWTGQRARSIVIRNAYAILVGKPERKRHL